MGYRQVHVLDTEGKSLCQKYCRQVSLLRTEERAENREQSVTPELEKNTTG